MEQTYRAPHSPPPFTQQPPPPQKKDTNTHTHTKKNLKENSAPTHLNEREVIPGRVGRLPLRVPHRAEALERPKEAAHGRGALFLMLWVVLVVVFGCFVGGWFWVVVGFCVGFGG